MNLIGVDAYHRLFTAAADIVKFKVDICNKTFPGRHEAELTAIEEELKNLRARAEGRDLAFWQSEQGGDLHIAVERLDKRVREACRKDDDRKGET